jgi:uncharacterized repeat protein (TIGR01451 family)
MRWLLAGAIAVACALCAPANAQVVEQHGGDARFERLVPPGTGATAKLGGGSPDAAYSNLGTFRNQSFAPGGSTQQVLNTITRMAADDINLVGAPPYAINGFRFIVTNQNAVDVTASMLIRFYHPNGPGGGPGTLIAAFSYNPIVFHAGVVGTIKTGTQFTLPVSSVWASVGFDNNGGSSGATAAQLDNLALGIFSPPEVGTSTDKYFVTTAAGSFASDNPVGTIANFSGNPPADFGWEILTAQNVDLSITNSDGVTATLPGGTLTYTITAANAGPNTVFGARVVDSFPPALACSWTCAGSAGNTCAASGSGNINDATVGLLAGGSVTYTATCAVSLAASGTLVNTATIFAPGTAVDATLSNNSATDTDQVAPPPAAVSVVNFTSLQPNPTLVGTATAATVLVGTSAGHPAPTGLVNVLLNSSGAVLCTITLPATTCTFAPAQTGDQELLAFYPGDAVYPANVSNVVVMSIAPVRPVMPNVLLAPSPAAVGTAVTVTATVAKHPLFPAPTGTVFVRDSGNGSTLCTITLPATSCAFTPGAPGAVQVDAIYGGDANYTPGYPPQSQTLVVIGITSAAPPGGSVGTAYSHTYTANAPLTYAVASGALPAGMTLAPGGLLNGTPTTAGVFTGVVTGTAGSVVASQPFAIAIGANLPGAPTNAIALPGNAQAGVAFAVPASNGGSPITSYTATSSPGGFTASGPGSPLVVGGLTNGTAYTFTVTATNGVGTGPASAPSNSVTPAAVPGPPTIGTATAGIAQATVTFTPPASTGGSPITGYNVISNPGGFTASGPGSPLTVTGLAGGTAYTFTVTATNAVGTGLASSPSNSVTPPVVPGAPTAAIATAGNAQATVTFAAPASNGGSPITGYTAISTPGGFTGSGIGSPITVGGLANGTAYSFTVRATNAVGTGPASDVSNTVTPATIPGAPTIVSATPGNAQATVAFVPPASNGGSSITSYVAACGAFSATGVASPLVVAGLVNGTAYSCTVVARNAAGMGPASAAVSVTPGSVPGAPTIGVATAGNAQATITFTAPTSNGGSPITSYTARSSPGSITASGPASPLTVGGLANGTAYTFTVTATNAAGTGPASGPSNVVTPASVPGAPTNVAANPRDGRAIVAFSPPASNGGLPITFYTASCGAFSTTGLASPLDVTGLTNGTAYSCSVTATNALGTGAASAAATVTPTDLVRSYTAPAATGSGNITAIFTGGGLTCTFITSNFIPLTGDPASPPAPPAGAIAFPHGLFDFTLTGCTPGSTITMTIAYPAALPAGTQYWKYGPEPGIPAPHWYVMPASINGSTVVFSITDGGRGDDDLAANSRIVDQGGPGVPPAGGLGEPVQTPTLSQWALMVLALMLLAFAAPSLRRRRF